MCSNCRNMRNLKEQVEAVVRCVREHRDEMAAKTDADHAAGGFDCCDSTEVVLCYAILEAAEYLGAGCAEGFDKVYLLTTGTGHDGDEWNVESIHRSKEGAERAKEEYEKPRRRQDGSTYRLESQVEEWELRE